MKRIFERILEVLREMFPGILDPDISGVNLEAELDKLADDRGLNWRVSVVDFLTLLEIDSSLENRKELAVELGVDPAAVGSAEGNEALRVAVFKKLKENGGDVPASLLD